MKKRPVFRNAWSTLWNFISLSSVLIAGLSQADAFDGASFAPRVNFPTDSPQAMIALEDFDGDRKTDVLAVNYHSRSLSVFRNTSQPGVIDARSFAPRVNFTVGGIPHHTALADINGDGKRDIVCVNQGSSEISIFLNTATAGVIDSNSFAPEVVLITPKDPRFVAAKDLNEDGKPDLLVSCYTSGTLYVLENTSVSNILSFGPRLNLTVNGSPASIEIGDVDGDNKMDLVVASASHPEVWIYRNVHAGGALTRTSFHPRIALPGRSAGLTLADMDGDRRLDIVSVHESENTVSVWRNTASPGAVGPYFFATRSSFPTGKYPYLPVAARLDGDSKLDVVVANASSHTISVFRNLSSAGTFTETSLAPGAEYATGQGPRVLAVADLDGDGLADIANANLSQAAFSVLRQLPPAPRQD